MLILLFLSILWGDERVLFADNALQTFLMINDGDIKPMVFRYPSMIVRVLPWLGVICGISLKWIVVLFSMSYALFHLCIAAILVKWKAWQEVSVLVLLHFVFSRHAFFWTPSELLQAISFFLLTLAALRRDDFKPSLTAVIMLVICIFYHPQSIFLLNFGILYGIDKESWKRRIGLFSATTIIFLAKTKLMTNWYDQGKFIQLENSIYKNQWSFWSMDSWSVLQEFSIVQVSFCVLLILSALAMFSIKSWWKYLLSFGTLGGSLLLFHYQNDGVVSVAYAEPSYLAILFPLCYLLVDRSSVSFRRFILIIILVFTVALIDLYMVSSRYTQRLEFVQSTISTEVEKGVLQISPEIKKEIVLDWGLSFETLLFSTMYQAKSKTRVKLEKYKKQEKEFFSLHDRGRTFATGLGVLYDLKNENYFSLQDSVYVRLGEPFNSEN